MENMNREWISASRISDEYEAGVIEFCAVARIYARDNQLEKVWCPCLGCFNKRMVKPEDLHIHLLLKGMDPRYRVWKYHGENQTSTVTPQVVESSFNRNDDWEDDNIDEMVSNVVEIGSERPQVFEALHNDSQTSLYQDCSKFTRLSATLKLLNMKAKYRWSDKSFTEFLTLIKEMLPEGNTLPSRTYEAKKVMCPMGFTYKKIHACQNDCILYRNEYEDFDSIPERDETRTLYPEVRDFVGSCMEHYYSVSAPAGQRPNTQLTWKKVKCPKQPIGTLYCGYYVMRWMLMVIKLVQSINGEDIDNFDWLFPSGEASFPHDIYEEDRDEILRIIYEQLRRPTLVE